LTGPDFGELVFLPVRTHSAIQVSLVDLLGRVTAPSIFLCQFALLEVIAELGNGHSPSMLRPVTAIDFRDEANHSSTRSSLIRILFDCADDFLVVQARGIRAGLRPTKLPDIRSPFAIDSFQTPICISSSSTAVAELENVQT